MWTLLKEADEAGYIMGAGTYGTSDTYTNQCGVATAHAYSIVAVFEMTSGGSTHRCLLMRNPWGSNYYSWTWNLNDPNWTDELIAQIPFDFDPTA